MYPQNLTKILCQKMAHEIIGEDITTCPELQAWQMDLIDNIAEQLMIAYRIGRSDGAVTPLIERNVARQMIKDLQNARSAKC